MMILRTELGSSNKTKLNVIEHGSSNKIKLNVYSLAKGDFELNIQTKLYD